MTPIRIGYLLILVPLLGGISKVKPQSLSQYTNPASAFITKQQISYTNQLGEYSFGVETSDGQLRTESRTVINPGTGHETAVVEGYYSYIGLDGLKYIVGYKADENGFHPEGSHLPPAADTKRLPPQVGVGQDVLKTLQGQQVG